MGMWRDKTGCLGASHFVCIDVLPGSSRCGVQRRGRLKPRLKGLPLVGHETCLRRFLQNHPTYYQDESASVSGKPAQAGFADAQKRIP